MLRRVVLACSVVAMALAAGSAQSPVLQLRGESTADAFGWSVAPAGDVNGDGRLDLVVGAPSSAAIAGFAGRAYVFLGPFTAPRAAAAADAVISATTFGDNLGIAVARAGDVNQDGFADVLLGARGNDAAGIQAGRAYVFFGPLSGPLLDTDADATISGEAFEELGRAVAPGGDLDGDGIDDVVVGAPLANVPAVAAGAAHVFYGPVAGPRSSTNADATITGVSFNELLGTSLVAADFDGDGESDLAVGAPRPPLNGSGTGRVYVFFGPLSGTRSAASADVILAGERASDELGSSLAAGDVNGDGRPDLIAGATQFFASGVGRAYVFHGPLAPGTRNAADAAAAILVGEASGDHFGTAVAADGDVDGDGFDDVVVGADSTGGATVAGRVYVFFGPLAGRIAASAADLVFRGEVADMLGHSVAHAGDLDQNGLDDALLGAPAHPASSSPGVARVVQAPRARVSVMASCTANEGLLVASAGAPALGGSVTLALDDAQAPGASTFLLLAASPAAGWPPCGALLPGIGELLLGLGPPPPVALAGGAWTGAPVELTLAIPGETALLGVAVFAQGAFLDVSGPVAVRLTGGLQLTVGL